MKAIPSVNPNQYGMAESIVCSRAKDFAGTYYSTFTGKRKLRVESRAEKGVGEQKSRVK